MVSDELRNSEKGILGNSKTEYYMPWCMQRHILNLIKKRDGVTASKRCWPEGSEGLKNPDFPELRKSELDDELRKSELDADPGEAQSSTTPKESCPEGSQGCEDPREDQMLCEACGHELGANECCQTHHTAKRARTSEGVSRTAETALSSRAGERQRQEHRRLLEEASRRPRLIPIVEAASSPAQLALARLRQRIANK